MIQFRYNETDSNLKHREVYYLYYKDKLYYSKPFLIPVKLEINRDEKEILLNNLIIDFDKQMCIDIFELIVSMKQIFDIENYLISNHVKTGELYRQIYKKDII